MMDILLILGIALVIGLSVNAIHLITGEGMLFGFIQERIYERGKTIGLIEMNSKAEEYYLFRYKPLFLCPPCMCSAWGSMIFVIINVYFNFYAWNLSIIPIWLITILCASYNAYIIGKTFN